MQLDLFHTNQELTLMKEAKIRGDTETYNSLNNKYKNKEVYNKFINKLQKLTKI